MRPDISGVHVCVFAERIYVNHKGLIELLDMENVVCRRVDEIIPTGRCQGCFDMETDGFMGPAKVVVEDTWGVLFNVVEEMPSEANYYEADEYTGYPE